MVISAFEPVAPDDEVTLEDYQDTQASLRGSYGDDQGIQTT